MEETVTAEEQLLQLITKQPGLTISEYEQQLGGTSAEQFSALVQSLLDSGRIQKNGDLLNPAPSDPLTMMEEEFRHASPQELLTKCQDAMSRFILSSGITDGQQLLQVLLMAANLGTEGRGCLTDSEKALADNIFGKLLKGPMDPVYQMISQSVGPEIYSMMGLFCKMGQDKLGLPLLRFILAFSYADGELSRSAAQKLEATFGIALMIHSFKEKKQ